MLGKRLSERLTKSGHTVISFDIATGFDLSKQTIPILDGDFIFHLAGIMPRMGDLTPEQFLDNLKMTLNSLSLQAKAKFIFASGSIVYDPALSVPISETGTLNPDSLYGLSKLISEILIRSFLVKDRWVILRIANILGSEYHKGLVWNTYHSLKKNEILKIEEWEVKRDRVGVQDVVDALESSMNPKIHGIFNIGSGSSHSTSEVVNFISHLMGRIPKFEYIKSDRKNRKDNLLEISKARKILNYQPKMDFLKELKKIINFWDSHEDLY